MVNAGNSGLVGDDKNSSPTPFASYALKFFNLGFSIIPCQNKRSFVRWKKYQTIKPSKKQVEEWIKKFPTANIGIIAGKASSLTIIDCDNLD